MLDAIIIALFCFSNSRLAVRKGLNGIGWVIRTILAMLGFAMIGSLVIIINYHGSMTFDAMQQFLIQNPLKIFTFYALEIAGGLLVRFLIERKQTGKTEQ